MAPGDDFLHTVTEKFRWEVFKMGNTEWKKFDYTGFELEQNQQGIKVSQNTYDKDKIVDMTASIPRIYGYAPAAHDCRGQGSGQAEDVRLHGVVDKWINLCMEHIIVNATTLPANAILELFTESGWG